MTVDLSSKAPLTRAFGVLCTLLSLLAPAAAAQTLQHKIGQMLMLGLPNGGAAKDTLIEDVADRNVGGVLMFAYNISSPEQIRALNAELQSYRQDPLLIAVDQEGGVVARLNERNGYRKTHTAATLGETFRSEDSTRAQARTMAAWLRDAGFNVNLAPVVDVKVDPLSPAIARLGRSFSSNEQTVVDHASWFIDEFSQQKIATAVKHFPGHGSAREDSHDGFTNISNTWQARELHPFRELIRNGYSGMIMTGHLFKRDWDAQYPVSLSRHAITDVLRGELGFDGVVISDELFMGAIQDNYGFDEAVVRAINAGTDILLFNTNLYNKRSLSRYVIDLVSRKVGSGEIDASLIDAAYGRIQKMKADQIATHSDVLAGAGSVSELKIRNFPNPFHSGTTLEVDLPAAQRLRVELYNAMGQHIRTLADSAFPSGAHQFEFDAAQLPSGFYFVRVVGDHVQATHKMVLLR